MVIFGPKLAIYRCYLLIWPVGIIFLRFALVVSHYKTFMQRSQVIHQYCNIVAFVNIFAHSPIFAVSCGEYNPQRLKQTEDEYSLKQ